MAAPNNKEESSRALSDRRRDSNATDISFSSHLDEDGEPCDCGGLLHGHGNAGLRHLYGVSVSDTLEGEGTPYERDVQKKPRGRSRLESFATETTDCSDDVSEFNIVDLPEGSEDEREDEAAGGPEGCGCGGLLHRHCGLKAMRQIEIERRQGDPTSSISVDDIKEGFPAHLPRRAGQELEHGPVVQALAKFFPIIFPALVLFYVGSSLFSLILSATVYNAPASVTIFLAVMTAGFFGVSLPFWIMLTQWHPCLPHKVLTYPRRTIDVVLTIYKEDLDVVVGTLTAIQGIEYPSDMLTVYLLDDAKRKEVEQIVVTMNSSSKIRHPITYVTRPNNKGRKGGNINHWIRKFDHVAGEFFVVLDADMQPFPDMCDIFFGHYYGFDPATRERIAYIQAPQHFSNFRYGVGLDPYETGLTFFYKVILPCMDRAGVVMYIGTCGLWRRSALKLGGGFQEQHATEDSVTGCAVHRTKISEEVEEAKNWVSKYVMQPVAVGISPDTLPDLMDQRLRWVVGSVQMCSHHNYFFGARELSFIQAASYFITSGYWATGIFCWLMVFIETMGIFTMVFLQGIKNQPNTFPLWVIIIPLCGFWVYWMLLPVCRPIEKIRSVQMYFCYVPVYIFAFLKERGFKIKVQATATEAGGSTRWHQLFWIPVGTMSFVVLGAAISLGFCFKTATNIVLIVWHVLLWVFLYWPIWRSLTGYKCAENPIYIDRPDPPNFLEEEGAKDERDFIGQGETVSETDSFTISTESDPKSALPVTFPEYVMPGTLQQIT